MPTEPSETSRSGLQSSITMGVLYLVGFVVLIVDNHLEEARQSFYFGLVITILTLFAERLIPQTSRPPEGRLIEKETTRFGVAIAGGLVLLYGIVVACIEFSPRNQLNSLYDNIAFSGILKFTVGACIPFIVMRYIKIPKAAMGLGKPRKGTLLATFVWIGTVLSYILMDLSAERTKIAEALSHIFLNIFNNGFTEEFLFRGILLGRLRRLMRTQWAILIQAIVFGAIHFPLDFRFMHGNIVDTIAVILCIQTLFGYALGILTVRTRTVLVGSLFHAIADATELI